MAEFAVEMKGIYKSFPGLYQTVVANKNIDLNVRKGEIHIIVGENGAGKSTLMNILYGLLQPDKGEILIYGEKFSINHPKDAIKLGIGMIHQHFMLIPSFTIGENFVLGTEPTKAYLLNRKQIKNDLHDLSDQLALPVDPSMVVRDAPVGIRQRVEILKTLYRGAEILILDEPTAVLTPQEIDVLFNALRNLSNQGKSVIMITHKLPEVMKIADHVTVLRDGSVEGFFDREDLDMALLAEKMTGRYWSPDRIARPSINKGGHNPILEVSNLYCADTRGLPVVEDVSFHLNRGEILAIAGVANNGQSELAETILGIRSIISGSICIDGEDISKFSVRDIRSLGVGHVPDDRYGEGCAEDASISRNMLMGFHMQKPYCNHGILDIKAVNGLTNFLLESFNVKINHPKLPISSLSGGNVQKAIVAREVNLTKRCLVAEQPSRGIDIGAAEYIYKRLLDLRNQGVGILLFSMDLTEVLRLCDRVLVMYRGRIVGERDPLKTNPKELGLLMTGALNEK